MNSSSIIGTASTIKQPGFTLEWDNRSHNNTGSTNEFFPMREWQKEAFCEFKDAPFMILNAPMGSGKSWMMCFLSAFKLKKDYQLRCIITVPQTIIASGFIKEKLLMPDGEQLFWNARHDLCSSKPNEGTIKYVMNWLANDYGSLSDRVLICTHATLAAVYKKLAQENQLKLLKNLLLWIDEAHHIVNVASESQESTLNNTLGKLVALLLGPEQHNIQIGLATATCFRGDRRSLLTDEMEKKFQRYNLPYDRYLQSMTYLKSFSFDFLVCGHDYTKAIELLINERKGKDIIYIPRPNSQHATGNKYHEVLSIIDKYKNAYGGQESQSHNNLMILKQEKQEFRILDLVDDHRISRGQKKNYINSSIIKENRDAIDVIIALGMFKEGANWIWADRSIIVGARSSLVDTIQMIGRLFRDAKDKAHVEIIQLLPFSLDQQDENAFRNNLNNYLKAIYAALILENIFNPVKIQMPRLKNEKSSDAKIEEESAINWLSNVLPDEVQQLSLIEDIGNQWMTLPIGSKHEEYIKIANPILEEYGITHYKEEVSVQILTQLTRQTLRMKGISVDDIDFHILEETHPLEFLLRYTSGVCNIDTFQRLREAIQHRIIWRNYQDAKIFVHSLQLKNRDEWDLYCKSGDKPIDIPAQPITVYSNYWTGWGDWLGNGNKHSGNFLDYEDAKKFVHPLGLKKQKDWQAYATSGNKPDFLPVNPAQAYEKKGWKKWGDFLGSGAKHPGYKKCISYFEAETYACSLNLKNEKEWRKYWKLNKPKDIPAKPDNYYKKTGGWVDWGTFLGTGIVQSQKMRKRPFEEARAYIRTLGLKSRKEWILYSKSGNKPEDVPGTPWRSYENEGWIDLGDWLGTNYVHTHDREYLSYDEARSIIRTFKLKNVDHWRLFCREGKRPDNIPSAPNVYYKSSGWVNWDDWLGRTD